MSSTQRRRTHIRAWRKFRKMTLDELGAKVGLTHSSLSRMENGLQPYSQHVLEDIAAALGTTPATLLARAPRDPEDLLTLWESIPEVERPRAIEMLKILARPPPINAE
jgi:transcriptional regulator with XRE-family HTH domain